MAVFNHFSSHFRALEVVRLEVDGLNFRKLSYAQSGTLVRPFSLEEIKHVVQECDNYKSPRPDGINFGFIKDF